MKRRALITAALAVASIRLSSRVASSASFSKLSLKIAIFRGCLDFWENHKDFKSEYERTENEFLRIETGIRAAPSPAA